MLLLLLAFLQPQQPRISRVVIVGAVLVFVAGVSLLVYFYRRYKRSEKDPEEDWDLARRSLFVNVPPPAPKAEESSSPVSDAATEVNFPVQVIPAVRVNVTREFASGIELVESESEHSETELPLETASLREPSPEPEVVPEPEPLRDFRATQVLASPSLQEPLTSPQEPVSADEAVPAALDDEVWTDLDLEEQPTLQHVSAKTATLQSAQPPPVARVDERSHREPFEAPRIERIAHREPYETPRVEPLTPREQAAATRELPSALPPRVERPGDDRSQGRHAGATGLFGSPPHSSDTEAPPQPPRMASETRELVTADSSAARVTDPSVAGSRARKGPTGSVLGLPTEPSYGPLILGDIVRNSSDVGIDALSNYGKDIGPKGGRGGTIALLLVVGLLGGAILLYLFVPSVHSRVGALVGPLRANEAQAAREAALKPKVQIIPSFRPEVNKNLVTARGAVDNISDESLENLSIEVSLQRGGDTPPEIRNVSVVPTPLPPNQRGTFEFEYDGKRDTGFTGYKITRVFSNGTEVKFRAPGK